MRRIEFCITTPDGEYTRFWGIVSGMAVTEREGELMADAGISQVEIIECGNRFDHLSADENYGAAL